MSHWNPVGLNRKLYNAWYNMIVRCIRSRHPNFHQYGGRGITVCEQWMSFEAFSRDMEGTWYAGAILDRIDNNGNYNKNNCRWTDKTTSHRNQRSVKLSLEKAEEIRRLYATRGYTLRGLGRQFDITHRHVRQILNREIWN